MVTALLPLVETTRALAADETTWAGWTWEEGIFSLVVGIQQKIRQLDYDPLTGRRLRVCLLLEGLDKTPRLDQLDGHAASDFGIDGY